MERSEQGVHARGSSVDEWDVFERLDPDAQGQSNDPARRGHHQLRRGDVLVSAHADAVRAAEGRRQYGAEGGNAPPLTALLPFSGPHRPVASRGALDMSAWPA